MHVCLWFTWVDRPEHQPGRAARAGPGRCSQAGQAGQARQVVIVVIVPCLVDITQLQLTARGGNTSLMTRLTSILLTKFCKCIYVFVFLFVLFVFQKAAQK